MCIKSLELRLGKDKKGLYEKVEKSRFYKSPKQKRDPLLPLDLQFQYNFRPLQRQRQHQLAKLFLHIGTHKTGTTAIQSMLWERRRELVREGILYPKVGIEGAAHHKLAWACGLGNRDLKLDYLTDAFEGITRQASKFGTDIVLSSEEFGYLHDLDPLKVLLDLFDVKVILYVRKQDHYLESVYNQHVRMYSLRYSGSIYQFFQRFNFFNQFNYRMLAGRWEKIFGRENLLVRPYGTGLVKSDVRADFLNVIGIAPKSNWSGKSTQKTDNISLPVAAIPYLSYINKMHLTKGQHQNLLSLLNKSEPRGEKVRLLRNEDALELYKKFEQSNQVLFSRYLNSGSVPFDELLPADFEKSWVNHEQIDVRKLLSILDNVLTPS